MLSCPEVLWSMLEKNVPDTLLVHSINLILTGMVSRLRKKHVVNCSHKGSESEKKMIAFFYKNVKAVRAVLLRSLNQIRDRSQFFFSF